MLKYLILVVCGLTLTLSSCNVDCTFQCDNGVLEVTGTKKVQSSKCDDCDIPIVKTWEASGYDCTCSEN